MHTIKKMTQQRNTKPKVNVLLIEYQQHKHNDIVEVLADSEYEVTRVLNTKSILKDIVQKKDNVEQISLIKEVEQHEPDVIVINVESPQKAMLESLRYISLYCSKPIVMFSEQDGTDLIDLLIKSGVTSYVAGESDFRRIKSILDTAIARFTEHNALKQELAFTKSKLINQRLVEQAKLLLMQNKNYTEQKAYHSMRKMAMDNGQKVEDVAKNILSLASIL